MTDFFDRASEQEEQDRQIALQQHSRRIANCGLDVSDSATECEACEEPIPYARREAVPGCRFCCQCQTRRERDFYER